MADENVSPPPPIVMLPWHDPARARMEAAVAGSRLPHAILVHGPAGVGKERFAAALAAALFCTGRGSSLEACGECADCALSRAGSHPDLHWLRRLEDKKSISVDQVRETCEQLGMTSMRRGYRIAIVAPAQAMTPAAQNALLKTLEEPAPRTLLVLVTPRPSRLLATLRSRCQRIEIARPPVPAALEWLGRELGGPVPPGLLDVAGGAPLRAIELAPHFESLEGQMCGLLEALVAGRSEATATAADMMGEGLPVRLDWLDGWLGQLVRSRMLPTGNQLTVRGGAVLQRTAAEVNISAAFRMMDRVREVRRLLDGSSSAPQLLVEALLVELAAAFGRAGVR
ncbi:MAG: DNA polymerase III subunit delta' [Gammaproteobacteria bacterium]|nr:DNA polymerase III subunit delta' [Gammaproteobacteria bacterium]